MKDKKKYPRQPYTLLMYDDIIDNLEGTIDEAIEYLIKIKEDYDEYKFDTIKLYPFHYGYEGGKELQVIGTKNESDEDYKKRITELKKMEEKKEAELRLKEYAEYERLKKKFGS